MYLLQYVNFDDHHDDFAQLYLYLESIANYDVERQLRCLLTFFGFIQILVFSLITDFLAAYLSSAFSFSRIRSHKS